MKVLIITHMYPSAASPLSGIFVQKQTESLIDAGSEAVIVNPTPWVPFLFRWNRLLRLYSQIPPMDQLTGAAVYFPRYIRFPRRWFFASTPKRVYRSLSPLIRKLIKDWRPDIIHAHVAHPCGAAAVRIGKKYGIPVVVTIHGMDFHYTMKHNRACERSVMNTLADADRVILVSEALQKNYGIEQWMDNPDNYRVIYNGIHVNDIVAGKQLCNKKDNDEFAPVLLTVAFLSQRKGHAYVLKALPDLIKRFPGLTYRIVGEGEERTRLEDLAKELGVSSQVVFLGSLSHQEAMCEMAACNLMVLPSWDEAFGVVYLEAMAHGIPVIGSQGEGAALLIEKENVGMTVPTRDATAIVHAASEILGNNELARSMGQKGRDLVISRFTWEHNAEQTLSLYREVLDDNR